MIGTMIKLSIIGDFYFTQDYPFDGKVWRHGLIKRSRPSVVG